MLLCVLSVVPSFLCTCITLLIQLISNHLLLGKYPNSRSCDSDFISVSERLVGTLRFQLLTRTRFRSCVLSVSGWRTPRGENRGRNVLLFCPAVLYINHQYLSGAFKLQWITELLHMLRNSLPHHQLLRSYTPPPNHQLLRPLQIPLIISCLLLYPYHLLTPPHTSQHKLLSPCTPIISCYSTPQKTVFIGCLLLYPHHQLLSPLSKKPLSVVTLPLCRIKHGHELVHVCSDVCMKVGLLETCTAGTFFYVFTYQVFTRARSSSFITKPGVLNALVPRAKMYNNQ